MAQVVMMKNPATGVVKKGFYGFSWTTFFFGGFPAIFRGQIGLGLIVCLVGLVTVGIGSFIWAFIYNKRYTTDLLEKGYIFADSEGKNDAARAKLGVATTAQNKILTQ
jgi:hypothetical protein